MTNNSTTRQIQKYDFHGDTLDVIPDGDRLHIGIRVVCEALGVDVSRQLKKLKTKSWPCVDMRATQMMHDARKRADIAAPRPTQRSFFLSDAAGAPVALAKPN